MMPQIILGMLVFNIILTSGGLFLNYAIIQSMPPGEGAIASVFARKVDEKEGKKEYVFFPIEKIIVSLADSGREHYFVIDLVLQSDITTDVEALKKIDPMVRSSVVSRLSAMPFTELRGMPIHDVQTMLDAALREDFGRKKIAVPFAGILVSKLIVQ